VIPRAPPSSASGPRPLSGDDGQAARSEVAHVLRGGCFVSSGPWRHAFGLPFSCKVSASAFPPSSMVLAPLRAAPFGCTWFRDAQPVRRDGKYASPEFVLSDESGGRRIADAGVLGVRTGQVGRMRIGAGVAHLGAAHRLARGYTFWPLLRCLLAAYPLAASIAGWVLHIVGKPP